MRKTKVISLMFITGFLAFSVAAWGQEKEAAAKAPEPGQVRKLIQVKNVSVNDLARLLAPWGATIVPDTGTRALAVVGPASAVEAIEEAVKKLDVPRPAPAFVRIKDVELTAYFLLAKRQASEAADLPPALNEVVAELKKVVDYKSFHLMSTAIVRTADGQGGGANGAVADTNDPFRSFELGYRRLIIIPQENQTVVHLDHLNFRSNGTIATDKATVDSAHTFLTSHGEIGVLSEIQTDIDLPEGQKVVVGKTSYGSSDSALVLVLTAKVMD